MENNENQTTECKIRLIVYAKFTKHCFKDIAYVFVSCFLLLIRVSVVVWPLLDSVHECVSGALRLFHLPVTDQLV